MNKSKRRKIQIKHYDDISDLGQILKEELLSDAEKYDKDNYNPLSNLYDKEILIPGKMTETITIRLTSQENEMIKKISAENGLSKSAFLRMIVKKTLSNTGCPQ